MIPEIEKKKENTSQNNYPIDLRFFILLDNDDYVQRSCWFYYNKYDTIMQNIDIFPGKLDIFSVDQYMNILYPFNFLPSHKLLTSSSHNKDTMPHLKHPLKNRVYVKIPKENIYVLLEDFEKYWVLSQLNELNFLFLRLNAENVKITNFDLFFDDSLIKRSLVGIHPGVDEYIASMGVEDHDAVEIRYPLPTRSIFTSIKYVYYEKWKAIIHARINEGKSYHEYYFKYENPVFLNDTFFTTLRTCGLTVFCELTKTFELHFEIFYYPDEMISL